MGKINFPFPVSWGQNKAIEGKETPFRVWRPQEQALDSQGLDVLHVYEREPP